MWIDTEIEQVLANEGGTCSERRVREEVTYRLRRYVTRREIRDVLATMEADGVVEPVKERWVQYETRGWRLRDGAR